ncbi:MAG TPA: type I methionyl aminopeptidase [Candidatus Pullichristensenella stercoripullorum]|nr:type I methionyl aminopeptidase [Candidatus Pullichristensenella stercoripullorum]
MITIKSASQIEKMRAAGALLHDVLQTLRAAVQPGVTTLELDRLAEKRIREAGAIPSFKGFEGFPFSICASVDDQVVHGFATKDRLREGQILSIDCGVILNGWQSDSALTVPVGHISPEAEKLIRDTEKCFWLGADQARAGNRLGDISHAVQAYAEAQGYGVIRDLCGHGIGEEMHEDPSIPNFGRPGRGVRLQPGMTLAIEPMICMGDWHVYLYDNDWTVATRDQSLCSHYEHTVLVTDGEPEVLSCPGANVREMAR